MTDLKTIPFAVHEASMDRAERANKRLIVIIAVLIVALIVSNVCWIAYENSFYDVIETTTCTIDSGNGGNAVYNETGEVTINGES